MEKKHVLKTIAENLRRIMNQQGFSNADLARKSHISPGSISKILNGDMSITIPIAVSLADGLDVDISEILSGLSEKKQKLVTAKPAKTEIRIGILSINNKRYTCIKNISGDVLGESELEGGLDLAETSSNLMQLIKESIANAFPKITETQLKSATLNLVTQSYEFEDTRTKFILFVKRHFNDVVLLPDWQITYFATFKSTPGISLVVDKGVSLSYMEQKTLKKLGGWKFPVYDLGGENWLGVETIHHTIEAVEGYIPASKLSRNVMDKFGGKIEKITETCFKGARDHDIYTLFCEFLLKNYYLKDPAAKSIIENGFKKIYRLIDRVDTILDKKVKVAINGSLSELYKDFFKKERLIQSPDNTDKARFLVDITKEFLTQHGV